MKNTTMSRVMLTAMIAMYSGQKAAAYDVSKGETAWGIGVRHGLPWKKIAAVNDIVDPSTDLRAGAELIEPDGWQFKAGDMYTIRKRDTLSHLALKFRTSIEELTNANPSIKDPDHIAEGMKILIPGVHHLQEGETVWKLSQKWNRSIEDILSANPHIGDVKDMAIGMDIKVPGTGAKISLKRKKEIVRTYAGLEDLMIRTAITTKIPNPRLFDMIVRTESSLRPNATRYEPGYQRRYVEKCFALNSKGKLIDNTYTRLFAALRKGSPSLSKEKFKKQLATSVGLGQIMYQVAVELGYRGTFEDLQDPATNLFWVGKRVYAHRNQTQFHWKKVSIDYNTGNIHGKPWPGHIKRSKRNYERSKLPRKTPQQYEVKKIYRNKAT